MNEENSLALMAVSIVTTLAAAEVGLPVEDASAFVVATTEYFGKIIPIMDRNPGKMSEILQQMKDLGDEKGEQHEPETEARGDLKE